MVSYAVHSKKYVHTVRALVQINYAEIPQDYVSEKGQANYLVCIDLKCQ